MRRVTVKWQATTKNFEKYEGREDGAIVSVYTIIGKEAPEPELVVTLESRTEAELREAAEHEQKVLEMKPQRRAGGRK
jgi:hypothetical protein